MKRQVAVFMVSMFLISCATAQFPQGNGKNPSKYSSVILKNFSMEGATTGKSAKAQRFADELPQNFTLTEKDFLNRLRIFENVSVDTSNPASKPYKSALIVEGKFTAAQPANMPLAIGMAVPLGVAAGLMGLGSVGAALIGGATFAIVPVGKSAVGADWTIKDAETGQVLATYNSLRRSDKGWGSEEWQKNAIEALTKDVALSVRETVSKNAVIGSK